MKTPGNDCYADYHCTGITPGFDAEGAGQMWMGTGGAVYNVPVGTYNLFAGGVNYLGGVNGGQKLPYIPEYVPQTSREKAAYWGTNGAMLLEGGVSLYRGARGFFSLEGTTNLASAERTTHILAGDGPLNGGHAWFRSWRSTWNGITRQKTMFPMSWSNEKIMTAINEVATSPNSTWINQTGRQGSFFTNAGNPAKFRVEGVFANKRIRVIVEGRDIITAFPTH